MMPIWEMELRVKRLEAICAILKRVGACRYSHELDRCLADLRAAEKDSVLYFKTSVDAEPDLEVKTSM